MSLGTVALGALMLSILAYGARRARRVASSRKGAPTLPARSARPSALRQDPAPPARESPPRPSAAPPTPESADGASRLESIFHDVVERYKLPPLPTAVTLAMNVLREPHVELGRVCRIIATDPALAARIVSLSRSPFYALRRSPQTLLEATTVLGLDATRRILVTAGMDMLHGPRTPQSEPLWHHSLATAIAAHMLARRAGTAVTDHAYLAGLLHDIGQVVLLQSNEGRFLDCWRWASNATAGCRAEHAAYGRDHAFIGASILYQWKIDDEIVDAVLTHHEPVTAETAILAVADHLAHRAGLGFVAEPETPPEDVLATYACATPEAMSETVSELQAAFATEIALLR